MSDSTGSETLKERLLRALKHKAVLAERSKRLQQQVDDFRSRESSMNHVTSELLQRQRELNYMLHRASSVLHQMQETNLALSAEFTHIVKELPAPRDGEEAATSDWDETINRVNDLFRRTHELAGDMQDDIFRTANGAGPLESMSANQETTEAVSETESDAPGPEAVETPQWMPDPPLVEHSGVKTPIDAVIVEPTDDPASAVEPEPEVVSATIVDPRPTPEAEEEAEQDGSVEELFRRLNTLADETDNWREDGTAAQSSPRKPSLIARIFGMGDES